MSDWKKTIDSAAFANASVSSLADKPNAQTAYGIGGLSAKELKAWFDKRTEMLKEKLNEVISTLGGYDALSVISVDLGWDEDGNPDIRSAKEWIKTLSEAVSTNARDLGTAEDAIVLLQATLRHRRHHRRTRGRSCTARRCNCGAYFQD